MTMRIGELAARSGVSRRSLRYYEQHDLLHPSRTGNGWREYDESSVQRARSIADLLAAGLTLEGVGELEACLDQHHESRCDDPHLPLRTYRARMAVLDRRLASMTEQRDELARRVEALDDGGPAQA